MASSEQHAPWMCPKLASNASLPMAIGASEAVVLGLYSAVYGSEHVDSALLLTRGSNFYLFVIVALSLVNAVSVNVPLFEVIVTNLIMVVAVWICELYLKSNPSKLIQYDRIDLITPERRPELIADLEERTGLKIKKVEVGGFDFLKDSVVLRVTYEGKFKGNEVDNQFKVRKSQWRNV